MSLITTYSGIDFDPINPQPQDISIIDISHALSFMSRANGHCLYFYSVAQHSINCALEAKARNYSKKVQLACLLHDGSEAYMADIVRPFKRHLPEYLILEKTLQDAIWRALGVPKLTAEEHDLVFGVDDLVLYNEFKYTMTKNTISKNEDALGDLIWEEQKMSDMQNKFLEIYNELSI